MHYQLALIILVTMSSDAQEKTLVEIKTPHGTVVWKELPGKKDEKVAQLHRELTPEELERLKSDAQKAKSFVARYASKGKKASHPLDELDFAFVGWLGSDDPQKESNNSVIRILGAAYGFYCIENLGVRWAWIKDEHGEDIALIRENPTTRGFPFTSIRYRIEDKKTDFIYALYVSLEDVMKDTSPVLSEANEVVTTNEIHQARTNTHPSAPIKLNR